MRLRTVGPGVALAAPCCRSRSEGRKPTLRRMPTMDDAYRQIDPGPFEPDRPGRPELWSGPIWVIGSLSLTFLAALSALAALPPVVVALLAALGVLIALVHYLKRKSWYCQAWHLYELKMVSFRTTHAPLAATSPPTPDFQQLDAHFPNAAAAHHSAWGLRNQPTAGPDRPAPTDEDRALWGKAGPALASVRSAEVLPGTCYRCRRWIWLYRALAILPHWA